MNYQRIYDQFIADRRTKMPDGTFEVHHILPRSLGGDDDQTNLIPLSPEDHFFAHLLLAKIHGGTQWVPVVMWLGGDRRCWTGRRSRLEYGWARRAHQEAIRGEGAYQFDHTIHQLEDDKGTLIEGLRAELSEMTGVTLPSISLLLNGKILSADGWFISGKRPQGRYGRGFNGDLHPMYRSEEYDFVHLDGREFTGTQFDLWKYHGVNKPSACRLVARKQSIAGGWYLKGTQPVRRGRAAAFFKAVNDNQEILKVS